VDGELSTYAGSKLNHRVEGGEPETPPGRPAGLGNHEQSVVTPRAQPGHRAHGISAETVGHQPFARRRRIKITTQLRSEGDHAVIVC
jgi:hypothetical protein